MHSYLQLFCVFSLISVAFGGVKIEITRIKEPPNPNSANPITEDTKNSVTTESTTQTPMPTTVSTTTTTQTVLSTASTASQVQNINLNTTTTTTTIAPITGIGLTNVSIINDSIPAIVPQMNFPLFNFTMIQSPTTPFLSELTRRQMRRQLIPFDYYCPCDLKIDFCDINCCCDVDCASMEILSTLKCPERDWSIHDYEDMSDLKLCSQTHGLSLFCIVDSNRQRAHYRKRDFKLHNVNVLKAAEYKWADQYDGRALAVNDYRENYVYGDSILIWDETTEEIHTIDIPRSFETSNCFIKSPINHLTDDEIKCIQTYEEHDQFLIEFQNKLRTSKVLKQRRPVDAPAILLPDYCKQPSNENETNNCIDIHTYHCNEIIAQKTCKSDTNLTMSPDFGDGFVANEISIQFHHNFTNILNCTIYFVYHDLSGDGHSGKIMRTIHLKYLELNESFATRDAHQVSGNIGYLHHKPIILTKYLRLNETNPDGTIVPLFNGILAYFHNETNCTNDEHYLKLPEIQGNGNCILNNFTFQTINFGENMIVKCNLPLEVGVFNETNDVNTNTKIRNNTHLCQTFQMTIFHHLLHRFELENPNATIYNRFNVFVSEMGNPRNDSIHWMDFRIFGAPNIEEIVAIDGISSTEFTCSNMILNIRFEFFYGNMMFGNVPNQALIKMAQIHFGQRLNLKFKLDDDMLKVPLYMDVMFYDFSRLVSSTAMAKASHLFSIIPMLILPIFITKLV